MPRLLIIGATGVLGNATAHLFLQHGKSVKILVRHPAKAASLQAAGAEVVIGDITQPETIAPALHDVDAVFVAVHGMLGRGKNSSEKVDDRGHRQLIDAAVKAGIQQFIYTSVYGVAPDHPVDFWRTKYKIEQYLMNSGLTYTILRPSAFMETHMHKLLGEGLLKKGKTIIFGRGENPTNFVSAQDVAQVVLLSYRNGQFYNRIIEIGGPENLTKKEVAALYGKHLNRTPHITHISSGMLETFSFLLKPFHPGLARIMRVSIVTDTDDQTMDTGYSAAQFGIPPTTSENFVQQQVEHYTAKQSMP